MVTTSPLEPRRASGRFFLLSGIALAVLGVVGYAVQIKAQRLATPWYLPLAATIGLFLVAVSLILRRGLWRFVALVLMVLFAAATWAFLLLTRLPAYTGPAVAEKAFPAFETRQANGETFTQDDLKGEQTSAIVFFRGRW